MDAIGICGSFAGGLVEYTESGGSVKRIHTGIPAQAGVRSAYLAKFGLTGPRTIIEGKKGLINVFGTGKGDIKRVTNELGKTFMLDTLSFKPYNCCYLIHPAIEGFLQLCNENQITSSDEIQNVEVGGFPLSDIILLIKLFY